MVYILVLSTTRLLTSPVELVGQHQVSAQLIQSMEPFAAVLCARKAAHRVMCPPVFRKVRGFAEAFPAYIAPQRLGLGVRANMHG